MYRQSLEGTWKLRAEFIDVGPEMVQQVIGRQDGEIKFERLGPNVFPVRQGFMEASLPCDVMTPLIEYGFVKDPMLKTHSKDCLWVKDLSWWFIREFDISEEMLNNEEVRLFIEMLDFKADIIINGVPVAQHKNTFRPFHQDIKKHLHMGVNQIVIRITSGIEDNYPKDTVSFHCASKFAICDQRVYLRKPQFTYGWDWSMPIPTVGIGSAIQLEGISGSQISSFRADTVDIDEKGNALIECAFEVENLSMCSADETLLQFDISYDGKCIHSFQKEYYLVGGLNFISENIEIDNAKLWWPNGYGDQCQYDVTASVTCRGVTNDMKPKKIGIRTIELDHSKLEDGSRRFDVVVNGVRVFCKGGNWVPADSLYLRIPDSKYKTLIEEAKEANFTMLRMWGGGLYEPDCFYEYCSDNGIMLMHDFMYSCAFYPDHLDWFKYEAQMEADYQTKRLAHYPCMAIWTGNNEIHESYTDWFDDDIMPDQFYGAQIFNYIQPQAVKNNSPRIPYMPSSPFYGDKANDLYSGDVHAWKPFARNPICKFEFGYELEAFDRIPCRFSSEYGFHGPLTYSSMERIFDGEEVAMDNSIWDHHEQDRKINRIKESVNRHLKDTSDIEMMDYLLYGGIMHGLLYSEMAEAIRAKQYGAGDLIWMYNDCWPESGWTIIDYFLTRKISFYFLKRAFATRKLIIREVDGRARINIINETGEAWDVNLEYGFLKFNGEYSDTKRDKITVDAHSKNELYVDILGDLSEGSYFAYSIDDDVDVATSLRAYYRNYEFDKPSAEIVSVDRDGEDTLVTVCSKNYIPVAYIKTDDDRDRMNDNYFELLPDVKKTIRIENFSGEPTLCFVEFTPKA